MNAGRDAFLSSEQFAKICKQRWGILTAVSFAGFQSVEFTGPFFDARQV
ncbi:hypothetical protein [Methyloversatilis universalis]|jgi:hypothetical protein|nr:hypothetical protein [Methyloversatilis universalis]